MTHTITLTEFGESQRLPDGLPPDELKRVLRQTWQNRRWLHDYADANNEEAGEQPFVQFDGRWVRARNYAGTVSVSGVTLHFVPRLFAHLPPDRQTQRAFAHLAFYLSYCRRVRFPFAWQESGTPVRWPADWIRLLAAVTAPLVTKQPYHEYAPHTAETSYLRGKLAVNDYVREQIARGQWQRLHTEQTPFTLDNLFNRIVKCAAARLEALASAAERPLLQPILSALAEVPLTHCTPADCDAVRLNRPHEIHRQVLSLCRFFLTGTAAVAGPGYRPHFAFLVPMERVFEDFVAGFVARHFPEWGAEPQQSTAWATDNAQNSVNVRPDIWLPHQRAVCDTKYKLIDTARPPAADLYQMAAYCQARQIHDAHLLYAATSPKPSFVLQLNHAPVRIHVHALPVVAPDAPNAFGVLTKSLKLILQKMVKK